MIFEDDRLSAGGRTSITSFPQNGLHALLQTARPSADLLAGFCPQEWICPVGQLQGRRMRASFQLFQLSSTQHPQSRISREKPATAPGLQCKSTPCPLSFTRTSFKDDRPSAGGRTSRTSITSFPHNGLHALLQTARPNTDLSVGFCPQEWICPVGQLQGMRICVLQLFQLSSTQHPQSRISRKNPATVLGLQSNNNPRPLSSTRTNMTSKDDRPSAGGRTSITSFPQNGLHALLQTARSSIDLSVICPHK